MVKPTSSTILFRAGSDGVAVPLLEFDGARGSLPETTAGLSGSLNATVEAELLDSRSGNVVWKGPVFLSRVEHAYQFELCVKSDSDCSAPALLRWEEVPKVLDISDGGYECLSSHQVGELLEDIIRFHDIVNTNIYVNSSDQVLRFSASLGSQDDLVELSEILINVNVGGACKQGDIVLVEVELFELSFFLVTTCAESTDKDIIVSLTQHIYEQRRRNGRRVVVPSIVAGEFEIIEISDFGCRAKGYGDCLFELGSLLTLELEPNKCVEFTVIHITKGESSHTLGLMFTDKNEDGRGRWKELLLQAQYPLLQRRRVEDHQATWDLLEKSGYLSGGMGEVLVQGKRSIQNEWEFIDSTGPAVGSSVVGWNSGQAVATIGITRVTENAWVAHAAAVLDTPEYLPYTRSIYAWRTRAILQNEEAEYHLAFFQRDKPFLDRFFRKFYLQKKDSVDEKLIHWNEWKYYAQLLDSKRNESADAKTTLDTNFTKGEDSGEPLLALIAKTALEGLHLRAYPGFSVCVGRPMIHLCQYFTSVWLTNEVTDSETICTLIPELIDHNQIFFTIRTKTEDTSNLKGFQKLGPTFCDGWEVVWICHRLLLGYFLSNSLRALELMIRKYGAKQVA